MISAAERHRLEVAYPNDIDAKPVLRACAIGLLSIMLIALAASLIGSGSDASDEIASVSARSAVSGR